MTNVVNAVEAPTNATVMEQIKTAVCTEAGCREQFLTQVTDWFHQHGVAFGVNLVATILIFLLGWLVIRIVVGIVNRAVLSRYTGDQLFPRLVTSATSKILWLLLIVMIIQRLGVNVAPILAGLGVTGFIVGFACQESLANFAAGVMIAFNQPFKVGEYVEVAGLGGSIREVGMMATILTTPDNKLVVVPNKAVWGSSIVNYSALPTRRVDLKFNVAYGSDLQKVRQIIADTLGACDLVLKDPAPTIAVSELAASAVTLTVRPWAKNADYWSVFFQMTQEIKIALDKNGIQIPFPQMEINMKPTA